MEFIRKTIDSSVLYRVFDIPMELRNIMVDVIILPTAGDDVIESGKKIQLGFVKGSPLPESFFDPLPEEELQSWGLRGLTSA